VLLGVVTGLASERACLQQLPDKDQRSVRCFGMGPEAAEKAASQLLEEGCTALLSFGIAGGLDSRLRPGSIVVAEAVVTDRDECFTTDPAWCGRLQACVRSGGVWLGRLLGSDRPLLSTSAKQKVASRFMAVAVDMESQAIGRMARQAGVPFVAVRAVADPAERAIPEWLADAIDTSGKPRLSVVAKGALAHSSDVPRLLTLARDQRAALRALRRVALDAGPSLAYR
jgi:adenosylhomocysteine nucleosidase